MKREIKSTIALDGEKAYKSALEAINREQRVLRSELVAVSSGFGENANSIEALTAKGNVLNKEIDQQKVKVGSLEQAVQDAAAKYGEADKKTDGYRIQLNNAVTALNKMQSEERANSTALDAAKASANDAATATNRLGDEAGKTEKKAKSLEKSTGSLGVGLKSFASGAAHMAMVAITAVATATGAAVAGALELGKQAMESADETQKLADVTGHTAEEIQVMAYQGKALGVDIETMTGAQGKLTKSMAASKTETQKHTQAIQDAQAGMNKIAQKTAEVAAQHGNHKKQLEALNKQWTAANEKYNELRGTLGPVSSAFKELGVQTLDSNGKLRDSKQVMSDAITALGKVANETERDALAQKLFGKSAMELEPIIKAGGKGLQDLADQAYKTGAIMSNDAVAGLDNAGDSLDALKTSAIGTAGTLLSGFMPQINGVIGTLQGLATSAAAAAKSGDWSGFVTQAGGALQQLVAQAVTMIPSFINIGTSLLVSLVTTIVSSVPKVLPQLISGVLKLVQAIVNIFATQGPALITSAIAAVGDLVRGLLSALPQLMQAAIQIVLALVQGISAQLPTLIPAAVQCILTLVQTLVTNLPMLIDVAIQLILALVDGIISAIPMILNAAPKIIISLVQGIVGAIPKLLDAALQIIVSLIKFLPEYFPMLIQATPQIITAIVTGLIQAVGEIWTFIPTLFTELWNAVKSINWGQLGESIINGLVDGLKNIGGNVWNALKGIVTGAVDSFKNFFGIHSPSTYMRDQLGIHLGGGLAAGIAASAGTVGRAMSGLRSQLSLGAMNLSLNPELAGAVAGGGSFSPTYNDHYITMPMTYNDQSTGWMSQSLKRQLFREYDEYRVRESKRTGK